MPNRPVVVFDLDGTLVDSLKDVVNSFLHAFEVLGLPRPPYVEALANVGLPLEDMYALFAPSELAPQLTAIYREHYPKHFTDTTVPFDGVFALLDQLGERGYLRAVATTKRTDSGRQLVEAVGLAGYLDHVQGTDGFPAKPAPDVILRAVAHLGGTGVVMVGDSVVDIVAGRAAGLRTYGVTTGTASEAELVNVSATVVAPSLSGLLDMLAASHA